MKCILCDLLYYVAAGNLSCILRTKINISGCLSYDPISDACDKCEGNYYYNPGKNTCLPKISNCSKYDDSNLDVNGNLICTECDDMYYISKDPIDQSTVCIKNTVPLCIKSHKNYNYCL